MNAVSNSLSEPRELGRLLVVYWRRWAAVTLLATAAAAAYALVAPKTWQAAQALIVRNEAVGSDAEPGRFRGAEDLKSIQETIMELSKSRGVLAGDAGGSRPSGRLRPAFRLAHRQATSRACKRPRKSSRPRAWSSALGGLLPGGPRPGPRPGRGARVRR